MTAPKPQPAPWPVIHPISNQPEKQGDMNACEYGVLRASLRLKPAAISRLATVFDRDAPPAVCKSWERGSSYGPPPEIARALLALDGLVWDIAAWVFEDAARAGQVLDLPPRDGHAAWQDLNAHAANNSAEALIAVLDENDIHALHIAAHDRALIIARLQGPVLVGRA